VRRAASPKAVQRLQAKKKKEDARTKDNRSQTKGHIPEGRRPPSVHQIKELA